MSKKRVNPSFLDFCEWYRANRPRFKTTWRKPYDAMMEWENVPGDFKFNVVSNDEFSKMTFNYSRRNSHIADSITIGYNRHYYVTGMEVVRELVRLTENGQIEAMGSPDLGGALTLLVQFRKDFDLLTLRTTFDRDGKLIYINATNNKSMLRVMLSLEGRDDE